MRHGLEIRHRTTGKAEVKRRYGASGGPTRAFLQPALGAPRSVRSVPPLGDDALSAQPAGVGEDDGPVAIEVLVEAQGAEGLPSKPQEPVLAIPERAP
jgi:hypothetical protein